MKFELINETLYMITDTPNPLWCNTEFPCLVSRKKDGDIGTYTKIHVSGLIGEKLVATGTKDGVIILEDVAWNLCELPYIYFNVIGYPVVIGSDAYALYCMCNGYKVRNKIHHPNTYLHMDGDDIEIVVDGKVGKRWHMETWDKGYKKDSGWQIYDPTSRFNVGDWVVCKYTHKQGKTNYEKVIEVTETTIATIASDGSVTEYDANGNHGDIMGWHIERVVKPHEVVIDFGNGINGKVRKYGRGKGGRVWIGKHILHAPDIAEPMRTTVLGLLKAQEEE